MMIWPASQRRKNLYPTLNLKWRVPFGDVSKPQYLGILSETGNSWMKVLFVLLRCRIFSKNIISGLILHGILHLEVGPRDKHFSNHLLFSNVKARKVSAAFIATEHFFLSPGSFHSNLTWSPASSSSPAFTPSNSTLAKLLSLKLSLPGSLSPVLILFLDDPQRRYWHFAWICGHEYKWKKDLPPRGARRERGACT